jgi:hypothetical protein
MCVNDLSLWSDAVKRIGKLSKELRGSVAQATGLEGIHQFDSGFGFAV